MWKMRLPRPHELDEVETETKTSLDHTASSVRSIDVVAND
jgi:hypothetical protein